MGEQIVERRLYTKEDETGFYPGECTCDDFETQKDWVYCPWCGEKLVFPTYELMYRRRVGEWPIQ